MEKRKQNLEKEINEMGRLLPNLRLLRETLPFTEIQVYEGFQGIKTAFEHYLDKCGKGDERLSFGVYPEQEEKYHKYWQSDHKRRAKLGITDRMLYNKGTDSKILKNRNSYKGGEARYMPSDIKTPAWFFIYADTVGIFLQSPKAIAIEIVNEPIAESFKAYFEDYWKRSKKFTEK